MGCCGSVNIAPETDLPPPEWGKPLKVRLKKKGFFSADYDVLVTLADGEEVKWMLLDAVGSFWDKGYSYFLKHRSPGQVDAAGKKTSTVLGAVNIRGEWDAFSFKVSGGDRDVDIGPYLDLWDGNVDWGISSSQRMWATWTLSKRAVLYSDEAMTNQIGWLDVTGSGTWFEEAPLSSFNSTRGTLPLWPATPPLTPSLLLPAQVRTRIVNDTDADGRSVTRHEQYRHTDCKTRGFRYKFNIFNTPMTIRYSDNLAGGRFWEKAALSTD